MKQRIEHAEEIFDALEPMVTKSLLASYAVADFGMVQLFMHTHVGQRTVHFTVEQPLDHELANTSSLIDAIDHFVERRDNLIATSKQYR